MANTPIKLNDNTTIPLLAFGTGTAHYTKDAQDLVTSAINAGFTHLDGAQIYKNEESLGAGIAAAVKKEGLTRSIGVSNFRDAQLREILDGAEVPPSINQVGVFTSRLPPHDV